MNVRRQNIITWKQSNRKFITHKIYKAFLTRLTPAIALDSVTNKKESIKLHSLI